MCAIVLTTAIMKISDQWCLVIGSIEVSPLNCEQWLQQIKL